MAKIVLACTQCGGQVELDDTREFGFCSSCGTKILIMTDTYSTTVNQNYNQTVVKNIYGNEKDEADDYIQRADTFVKLHDLAKADQCYRTACDKFPHDWRGWMGMIKAFTDNFENFISFYRFRDTYNDCAKKALAVAGDNKAIVENMLAEYEKFVKEQVNIYTEHVNEVKKFINASTNFVKDKKFKLKKFNNYGGFSLLMPADTQALKITPELLKGNINKVKQLRPRAFKEGQILKLEFLDLCGYGGYFRYDFTPNLKTVILNGSCGGFDILSFVNDSIQYIIINESAHVLPLEDYSVEDLDSYEIEHIEQWIEKVCILVPEPLVAEYIDDADWSAKFPHSIFPYKA